MVRLCYLQPQSKQKCLRYGKDLLNDQLFYGQILVLSKEVYTDYWSGMIKISHYWEQQTWRDQSSTPYEEEYCWWYLDHIPRKKAQGPIWTQYVHYHDTHPQMTYKG